MHWPNSPQRTRRGIGVRGAITTLVVIAALAACQSSTEPRERDVLLGGLFSLTGDWSNLDGRARPPWRSPSRM